MPRYFSASTIAQRKRDRELVPKSDSENKIDVTTLVTEKLTKVLRGKSRTELMQLKYDQSRPTKKSRLIQIRNE